MNSTAPNLKLLPSLTTLRDFLNLLASLRDLSNPFASAANLQNAIELLLNLGASPGLDPTWLRWLQTIHDTPQLLNLALAVGQYLENLVEPDQPPQTVGLNSSPAASTNSKLAVDWNNVFAVLGELVQLLERVWPLV